MELWLLLGILSYLSYSISTSIDKYLMRQQFNPTVTNTVKMFLNSLFLVTIGLLYLNLELSFRIKELAAGIFLGFLYAASGVIYFKAVKISEITELMPFYQSISIVLTFIFSVALFKEAVSALNIFGILFVMSGMIMVLLRDRIKVPSIDQGIFLISLTILINIIYSLLAKIMLNDMKPINLAILMYFFSAGLLFAFMVFFKPRIIDDRINLSCKDILKISTASFFGAIGTLLLFTALTVGYASKVYSIAGVMSVFIFFIGTIFLGEKVFFSKIVGTVFVFSGIYLISL